MDFAYPVLMEKYDICIIGLGPSGYAAAMRAADFGQSVLLIEKQDRLGGAGIWDGALSSKTFWEISRSLKAVNQNIEKFDGSQLEVPFKTVVEAVETAVGTRSSQIEKHLDDLIGSYSAQFDLIRGRAKLLNETLIEIATDSGSKQVEATNIILATGSRPRYLPNIAIDELTILTSDGIHNLDHYPESMVILGAGVIGCEFGAIFSNLGKTRVYLIDKSPRILPFEDEDIVEKIDANLEAQGVIIHRQAALVRMEVVDGHVEYELSYEDGQNETIQVEKALVSVGRLPNVEDLGLETLGIEQTPGGHIVADDTRTNIPNIYAVGDLTADIALVNVGELEGRHAVEKIMGMANGTLVYENISQIMFLVPEAAGVGMNEIQAQQKGIPYRLSCIDYNCIPRAIAMENAHGLFKMIVTDDEEMRILGIRALGEHASSAIQGVALLIAMKKGVHELADLIHPHPSIIEGVQECARMLLGNSVLKPSILVDHMKCCRWQDGQYHSL